MQTCIRCNGKFRKNQGVFNTSTQYGITVELEDEFKCNKCLDKEMKHDYIAEWLNESFFDDDEDEDKAEEEYERKKKLIEGKTDDEIIKMIKKKEYKEKRKKESKPLTEDRLYYYLADL